MSFLESLSNALTPGTKVDIADVPVGGGIVLTNGPYVVTQPTEGAFHAFRKNCTHQMRPVNEVTSEGILWPAHGSVFAQSDGHPLCGPAERPLKEAKVEVRGDRLVITG